MDKNTNILQTDTLTLCWLIRKRGTNQYMPKMDKSRSTAEAMSIEAMKNNSLIPYVFYKESTAKGWLTAWLKGYVLIEYNPETESVEHRYISVSTRKRKDYELVLAQIAIFPQVVNWKLTQISEKFSIIEKD